MRTFKVTKGRRVFLNDTEIKSVIGFSIDVAAGDDPQVVIRVAVDSIEIDGYTDAFSSPDEA